MSHNAIACILVDTPKVFDWLGHMPIISWCLTHLTEVRGIDRAIIYATPPLLKAAERFQDDFVEVLGMEKPKGVLTHEDFLFNITSSPFPKNPLAVIRPTVPFLPASKIEECVENVLQETCDFAYTARCFTAPNRPHDSVCETNSTVEVAGCRVFLPGRGRSQRAVPVSLIESLDILKPDDYRVAEALTTTGAV